MNLLVIRHAPLKSVAKKISDGDDPRSTRDREKPIRAGVLCGTQTRIYSKVHVSFLQDLWSFETWASQSVIREKDPSV